ncbi:hypothetical protein L2D14_04015 [Thalassospiraceae bacterium LMO-JJ14]|nr:hypothetical protein L2D14_04015 [Thalassospiraceae bacterium LMO-JJ14]
MQLPNNSIPVAIGAAIGVVAISIISLANGWVMPTSKVDAKIEEMTVSVQASICAARAEDFLNESNSTVNLEGYQAEANEKRQELARSYTTPLMGNDAVDSSVVDACARMLNKSRS